MTILECGLDEAGRGPLAGPVTAGCVILPEDFPFEILNDSKKLSEKKREEAEKIIRQSLQKTIDNVKSSATTPVANNKEEFDKLFDDLDNL